MSRFDEPARTTAETALRKSEAQVAAAQRELQLIIDTIPALVATFRPDGTCSFVNQTWRDYTGLTLQEATEGERHVHPDDAERAETAWRASLANEEPFLVQLRLRGGDGKYRWHAVRRMPLRDESGEVVRWCGVAFDIEEQKTAANAAEEALRTRELNFSAIGIERAQREATLRRSEARKAAILDSALDCIVTIDQEGCITEFNPAAERTFGYRRSEVIGRQLADIIIPPSLREQHRRGLARYLTNGEARVLGKRIEMRAMRADGSEIPVEIAITRLSCEGGPCFTGYLRDITESKRAEERLRRGEAFLSEAQRLSSTGSFSWRVATGEMTCSEQLCRIFELDLDMPVTLDLIGTRIHVEDLPAFREQVERARRDGCAVEFESRLQMPDHLVKHVQIVAHGSPDEHGQLEYIGAVQDVTQRRSAEEALAQARSELAHVARVTSLGVLTASIAHEVNQPLAAIITNAESGLRWLARLEPDVERVRELTTRVVADARRASEIIDRIRAMTTGRAPKQALVSLDDIVEESMVFLRHEFRAKSTSVSLDLAAAHPQVLGDRTQLQQVIVNLAINAIQAMAQSESPRRNISIRTMVSNPQTVCCTIEDSGPGIDLMHVPRLFDTFFTTKDTGMGMGLPISRSIIEAHGGHIRADNDSALGGARFSFALPGHP